MCHLPYNCHLHSQWARLRRTKVACHIHVSFVPALTETRRSGFYFIFILFYRKRALGKIPPRPNSLSQSRMAQTKPLSNEVSHATSNSSHPRCHWCPMPQVHPQRPCRDRTGLAWTPSRPIPPSYVGRIHVLPNQAESMPKIIKVVQPSAAGIDILIEEFCESNWQCHRAADEQTNKRIARENQHCLGPRHS